MGNSADKAADPSQSAVDYVKSFFSGLFDNPTVQLIVYLAAFLGVVIWVALVFWTFRDARRRIDDGVIVAVATLTALVFGPAGALVYAIVRPPEYLEEVRARELEIQVLEAQLQRERSLIGAGGGQRGGAYAGGYESRDTRTAYAEPRPRPARRPERDRDDDEALLTRRTAPRSGGDMGDETVVGRPSGRRTRTTYRAGEAEPQSTQAIPEP